MKPTEEHLKLQDAFDHFNAELFDGELPQALIVLRNHGKWTLGYFRKNGFIQRGGKQTVHEIALCGKLFYGRTDTDILGTLVHEMVHHWQFVHGKPSRGGYHNGEWGVKMDAVGLTPSNTGKPGGKRTGQQMSHFIVEGGAFEESCKRLLKTGWKLGYQDHVGPKAASKAPTRVKFTCPQCEQNAWGKPTLSITCTECEEVMEAQG